MGAPPPSRQVLEATPARALRVQAAGTHVFVRSSLAAAGYTPSEHLLGWDLLHRATGYEVAVVDPRELNEEAQAAIRALDAWDEPGFARIRAALDRHHPAQSDYVFANDLHAASGAASVRRACSSNPATAASRLPHPAAYVLTPSVALPTGKARSVVPGALAGCSNPRTLATRHCSTRPLAVDTLLKRLDDLEKSEAREPTRKQDHAALETLAARGFPKQERTRLRQLVTTAQQGNDAAAALREENAARDAKAEEAALLALHTWYTDWATTARALFKRRDHLIALGLASRRRKKPAPPDSSGNAPADDADAVTGDGGVK